MPTGAGVINSSLAIRESRGGLKRGFALQEQAASPPDTPAAYSVLRVVGWVVLALTVATIGFVAWLALENWAFIHV